MSRVGSIVWFGVVQDRRLFGIQASVNIFPFSSASYQRRLMILICLSADPVVRAIILFLYIYRTLTMSGPAVRGTEIVMVQKRPTRVPQVRSIVWLGTVQDSRLFGIQALINALPFPMLHISVA